MITEKELQGAIDELETAPSSYDGCAVLAALYALKDRYYGNDGAFSGSYSGASFGSEVRSEKPQTIHSSGDSEFLRAVEGKNWEEVLPVIDELLMAVKVYQPKLYGTFLGRF